MILRKLVLVALLAGVCAVRADKQEEPVAVVEALSVPEDLDVAEDRSSDEVNVEYVERNGEDQIALESSPDPAQERSDLAIVPVPDGYLDTLGAPQASQTPAEDRQDSYGAPVNDQDSYGVPAAPVEDGYGSPAADPISDDGYGAPQAPVVQRPHGPVPVPLPLPVNPASIVIPQGPKYGPPKPKYRPRPPPPKRPAYRPPPQKRPPPPKYNKPKPPPPKYKPRPPPPKPQYKPRPQPPKPSYKPAPPKYKPPPPPKRPVYKPPKRPPPPKKPIYKPQKPKYSPLPPKVQPQYKPAPAPQPHQQPAPVAAPADEPWPKAQPDMPKITSLDVTCEKNLMKVFVEFDKPFYGIIFSKGHYSDVNCVHLPAGLGRTSAKFDVSINSCGTIGNTENGLYGYGADSGSGTFFENTIVVQYDPQVQEVWDQARKLRCTWHDQYEKSVTFRPFPVDMLDVVRADFAGDNVGCWMQIQVGKGPWASEVSGLVKIGQTMTMVLAIKDDEQKFDMMVRNCMAHDGKRAPIQLVDQKGCVTRPKLMSKFSKIKNFGASASVLSYAHFQAFKFPDSMEVHFQCTIQICRYQCPDQCDAPKQSAPDSYGSPSAPPQGPDSYGSPVAAPIATYGKPVSRTRREAEKVGEIIGEKVVEIDLEDVGVEKVIQVVSSGDLTFAIKENENETDTVVDLYPPVRQTLSEDQGYICMSTPAFAATLVILLAILVISCLLSAFLCLRHRSYYGETSLIAAFANPVFAHKKGHF
jgi:hypothetical protein